jgi:hypothetical protein
MQNPDHQKAHCPKCHADRGEPCVTIHGAVAEKVHYGRPYWSEQANQNTPLVIRTGHADLEATLVEFTVLTDLLQRDHTANPPDETRPTLFPGTDICADCGDSYRLPALTARCETRHDQPKRKVHA